MKRETIIKKSVWMVAVFLWGSAASADYIVTDGIEETLTRYDDSFGIVWKKTGERSIGHVVISPINENVYACYNGTDKLAKQFGYMTGVYIARTIPAGDHVNDLRFGYDYNGDDIPDLWSLSRESLYVYDGAATPTGNPAVLLDSWTIADTAGENGTGGTGILFGPDINSDGHGEMFTVKAVNAAGSRINVWDVANSSSGNLVQLASYNADSLRDSGGLILGPDVNSDGRQDLWVANSRRWKIQVFDYATGADLGAVTTDFGGRYFPLDIEHGPNGTILIGTRFSSSLDPDDIPDAESDFGNLIQYDPATNTSQLLLESASGRITGVAYVGTPPDPCPNPPAADLSGDCRVNVDDLVMFIDQWLMNTDPTAGS